MVSLIVQYSLLFFCLVRRILCVQEEESSSAPPLEFGLWVGNSSNSSYIGKYVSPLPDVFLDDKLGPVPDWEFFGLAIYLNKTASYPMTSPSSPWIPPDSGSPPLGRPFSIVSQDLMYDGAWPLTPFRFDKDHAFTTGLEWQAIFQSANLTNTDKPFGHHLPVPNFNGTAWPLQLVGPNSSKPTHTWYACQELNTNTGNFSAGQTLETWEYIHIWWANLGPSRGDSLLSCPSSAAVDIYALDYHNCHHWDINCTGAAAQKNRT